MLQAEKLDALLLTSVENRFYATDFHASDAYVLITHFDSYLFTDARYIEAAQICRDRFVVELKDNTKNSYLQAITRRLAQHHVKTLGFESLNISLHQYDLLSRNLSVRLKPAGPALMRLRQVKRSDEIDRMAAAQRIAERAFDRLMPVIRVGMTEKEVAAHLVFFLLLEGAESLSFEPIVVAGPNTSRPHGEPGTRPLAAGDFLMLDFGVKASGYCSDTTRTLAIGDITEEMKNIYEIVLRAQEAGIQAARAGVTGHEIDACARGVIESAGYGPYFGHSFGHGIGLDVHEPGGAVPQNHTPLPTGTALSAEPGIYLPGRFGVRIEDVLILEDNGARNLTTLPKTLLTLPV